MRKGYPQSHTSCSQDLPAWSLSHRAAGFSFYRSISPVMCQCSQVSPFSSGCSVVRGTEACVMCHQYPGCEIRKSTSPRGCSQPEQDNPIPAVLRRPAPHISSSHSCCVDDFASPAASSGVKNLRDSFSELREGGGKRNKAEVGHGAELYGLVIV